MILNQSQKDAITSVMTFLHRPNESYMVIKGRAGTGKSTLLKALLPEIDAHLQVISLITNSDSTMPVQVTATTNKAVAVTADITSEEAITIHSLLGLRITQNYQTGETKLIRGNDAKVIKDTIIIIDEAFFFCPVLLKYLTAGTLNCKIIFIGDPYQCAPVRQTHSPIEDLLCRTEELTQVMRNSGVLTDLGEHWRNTVITGTFSPCAIQQPGIIDYVDGKSFQQLIEHHYLDSNATENTNKIICWTNKQSNNYSDFVRKLRGLPAEFVEDEYLQVVNTLPKLGIKTDSIIRIKTFHDSGKHMGINGRWASTYNGVSLFIPNTTYEYTSAIKTASAAKDWPTYFAIKDGIPDLRAIHACTVHKAQGSTYENVFVDLPDIGSCNIASDVARLMHVASTRPSKRIIFRGKLPDKYGG